MKQISTILSVISLVAVAVLFVLFMWSGKKGGQAAGAAVAEGVATEGVVYVNMDSLVKGYDMYFDLQKEFEAEAGKKDADFTAKMKKFENDAKSFAEKVEKGLITRSQAQQLQEGLARREQELMQLRQQLQGELAEQEGVMMRQIQTSLLDYITEYNKEKKYSLIISNTSGSVLLYGDPALNITNEVLQGLNESYIKVRKTKK